MCLREVQKSLAYSSKLLLQDKIGAFGLGAHFRILENRIDLPGGGIIIFQGMQDHTAESIKSLEDFDIAWFDEAQNASARSVSLLTPTMRSDTSEMWWSWNPTRKNDPVEELFRENADSVLVDSNYWDNPWFPDALRRDMERDKRRDPDKYAHVWCGKYEQRSEARVFHNWEIDEFETPPDARFYFGADWGFSVDPTVLVRCWFKNRTLYVDHEAWQVGCEIDKTPELFDKVPDARKWPIRADSARPETISYMRNHGYPKIKGAVKGPGSVEDGIQFVKAYDIKVHPRCKNVIDELSHYSWKVDKHTEEVLPVLKDKKNHTIDALRYAVEGRRRGNQKAKFGHLH